jgi:hypothetical protein
VAASFGSCLNALSVLIRSFVRVPSSTSIRDARHRSVACRSVTAFTASGSRKTLRSGMRSAASSPAITSRRIFASRFVLKLPP